MLDPMVSDLLAPELVLPALDGAVKDAALLALAACVAGHHGEIDEAALLEALRARERQVSTALVDGVAVPHARMRGLSRMVGAIGRSRVGIDCDSHDGRPTHLFFLLVGPTDDPGRHVKLLARVSRFLHEARGRLMDAPDAAAILLVLADYEQRGGRAA